MPGKAGSVTRGPRQYALKSALWNVRDLRYYMFQEYKGPGELWLDKVKHIYSLQEFFNMLHHEFSKIGILHAAFISQKPLNGNFLSPGGAHKIQKGQKSYPGLYKCRFHGQHFLKEIKLKAGGRLLKMKLCVDRCLWETSKKKEIGSGYLGCTWEKQDSNKLRHERNCTVPEIGGKLLQPNSGRVRMQPRQRLAPRARALGFRTPSLTSSLWDPLFSLTRERLFPRIHVFFHTWFPIV